MAKIIYKRYCPKCHGSGDMVCPSCGGDGYSLGGGQCSRCYGTGETTCSQCSGSGEIEVERDE